MACEAYMKTDYYKLADDDFQQTLNDYLNYLVKEEKFLKYNIILKYYKKKPINQASFFISNHQDLPSPWDQSYILVFCLS